MTDREGLLYDAIKRELDLFRSDVKDDVGQLRLDVRGVQTSVTNLGDRMNLVETHERDVEVAKRTKRSIRKNLLGTIVASSALATALTAVATLLIHSA